MSIFFEEVQRLLGDLDVDHPSILGAPLPPHQLLHFQSVDQSRHRRNHLNHPLADFEAGQRLSFAPQDAEDVVLGGRQPVFTKQSPEAILKLIVRSQDIQHGFLLRRLERSLLLQFPLQLAVRHALDSTVFIMRVIKLHIIYRHVKCVAAVLFDPSGSSSRKASSQGQQQLPRSVETHLPSQQRPGDVSLFPQKTDPCLGVGSDVQVRLTNVTCLNGNLFIGDHDGRLSLFVTRESEVVRGVQTD